LIWRVRERSAFRRLGVEGRRTRAGALWCTFVIDPTLTPPQVAFAIGRAFGPAVARNRLRRRLRALLAASPPPAGLYLFGAQPAAAERSSAELASDLQRMLGTCRSAAQQGS
jgi:ribonuclease P protein component